MNKYYELQTRKVVSAYGGIGSIIETSQGAIKIEEFDQWPFVSRELYKNFDKYEIKDQRLLKRLRYHFPKIKGFFQIPTNTAHHIKRNEPEDTNAVISAEYFPRWWYCPKCERLRPLTKWWEAWQNTMKNNNSKIDREVFIKPKCFACFNEAAQKNKKTGKKSKLHHELEQVRFIMTSSQGNIRDIPWDKWPHAEKKVKEEDGSYLPIKLDFNNPCCEAPDLRYIRSSKFIDLSGVRIKCDKCGKYNTLEGLFSLRLGKIEDEQFKPVIRSSTSVFYPLIMNSIFLPTLEIEEKDKDNIKTWANNGKDTDFIYDALLEKYPKEIIKSYLHYKGEAEFESEIEYRTKEYNYLINPQKREIIDDDFSIDDLKINQLNEYGINYLMKLKRIKLVTVQTAYTRQEPYDKDLFLKNNEEGNQIKFKYTSKSAKYTEYLPAIESYGEGIFLSFAPDKLERWFEESWKISDFKERIEKIMLNSRDANKYIAPKRFDSHQYLAKFILIHTLSHLLIKEFEFLVGYPATSLNERLFINGDKMQGVLIYTVAGAEGSYGGLISNAHPDQFKKILQSALFRAKDCASDPVCYNSEEQGIGGLNLAACYSCALLPETSCEEFNSFLDRALLIHKEYGYFR